MSKFTAPSVEELQAKFPNHVIKSFIAQGGMGAVYLATQTSLDRPVAIKILPQEFGEDKTYRTSFETEAKAIAKLNHSNLVGIYDFGDVDGMLYIIMEYVPGRSLFDTAHGQAVEQLEAARLIADMCHGLEHAHKAGMIHRDIKPANVLIDDEARPKIVDFGLAHPLDEDSAQGVVFGTPGYTAPEVVKKKSNVDQRSDIFSMGVMLYELLTGHMPGNPIVPASAVSGSDKRFDTILNKAIHPDPDKRYHTASEMAEALEVLIKKFKDAPGLLNAGALGRKSSALGGRPRVGGISSSGGRTVVMSSKSGGGAGLVIGLILVLLIGLVVIVSISGDDEPKGPSAAELELKKQQQEEEELRQREEKRMAEVAKKRREERKLKAEMQREREKQEARERERIQREEEEAMAEERRKQEQLRIKEEERQRAIAEAEAQENETNERVYDHASFIAKERADISVRAATVIRDYREEREKILDREERDAKRAARRSAKEDFSDTLEALIEEYFEAWKEGDDLPAFPEKTPDRVKASLNEFIAEMTQLDTKLFNGLSRYKSTYAKELRKKSEVLERENVTASVDAINAELEALKKHGYFLAIVKSENPDPDTFEELIREPKELRYKGKGKDKDKGKDRGKDKDQ